jgi:hypothetical protein
MTDSTDNAPRRIGLIQDDFLGGMWALASKDEADIAVHYIRADLAPDPLSDPRVKALVEAADAYVEAADPVAGTEQISRNEWDEYCDALEAYHAARAAFEGGKTDE